METLKELKMNILEQRVPFFEDEELLFILNKHDGNVRKATYECLLIKAEKTGLDVSGLTTKDSSEYFKMLASQYVTTNTGVITC